MNEKIEQTALLMLDAMQGVLREGRVGFTTLPQAEILALLVDSFRKLSAEIGSWNEEGSNPLDIVQ